ncbi:CBS domain-containing protein [Streptomyces coelicoflavus]|uniref:CBS domain-containing protein n=1 Tax=Streptomyces coelicoflavus TaxID=285562 RepID=UPI003F4A0189
MSRPVVRVRTDTSFKAVAEALTHNDVTAAPEVDDIGRPVGVVSQADLVRKVARRPDPAGPAGSPSRRTAPPVRRSRSRSWTKPCWRRYPVTS